jgi:hypothetical protein
MTRLLLLGLLCLLPVSAWAQDMASGNYMLDRCKDVLANRASYGAGVCVGKVSALRNVAENLDERMRSCVPLSVTDGQAVRVVVKQLEMHPETLDQNFLILTLVALRVTWPCK